MINLLFLLAVSVPQVLSANDCNVVETFWYKVLGQRYEFHENSCCPSVPGLTCTLYGRVKDIDWSNIKLENRTTDEFLGVLFSLPRIKTL
jgi:hypothetical protein